MATFQTIAVISIGVGVGLVVWIVWIFGRAKRQRDEAIRIIRESTPELAALREAITVLRHFVADAYGYRPKFTFPRDCEGSGDGPDPEPWITTVDNLVVPKASYELSSIYNKSNSAPPEYPRVELSPSDIKIVTADALGKSLIGVWRGEAQKLKQAANQLQNELAEQKRELAEEKRRAEEARDLMNIHIDWQLAPIRSVYKEYTTHTKNGIEKHFQLALRTLPLPLPSNFPWRTFYDATERLLQVNQRVPFIADIVVKRADSKRAPSKRDTDNFQRRLVPAVSLHIAQHVALNDLYDDVDSIAVNCWCRYFERTTGHLKRAFVSSLKVEKKDILPLNINKADALDAFRALRGAYVYSTEEIVPIEPQIRLDKKDDRFVEGKEVLEESWSRKSVQDDKWSFCLTAGTLWPANQERQ
jgi:hypothetical protein